ncbi:anti-sigma factor domain-containing protein [Geodermatophilus sp. SYSU D01186]
MSGPARDHAVFDELAVGWALHALEPEEEVLVAAHLPGCPRCLGTVAETGEVLAALAASLPVADPPDELREELRNAVRQTPQVRRPPAPRLPASASASRPPVTGGRSPAGDATRRAPEPAVPGPAAPRVPDAVPPAAAPPAGVPTATPASAWRRVLPNALVAAAVATILALGTWNVVLSDARDEARATVARQADVVNALLTPGSATVVALSGDDGAAVATVVVRNGQLQVVDHGLPVNDVREQTYVLWGTGTGGAVALGTFDVLSPHSDLRAVGSGATGLDVHDGYAVSLEPGRQAPSEPTDIVARGEVTN